MPATKLYDSAVGRKRNSVGVIVGDGDTLQAFPYGNIHNPFYQPLNFERSLSKKNALFYYADDSTTN